MNYRMSEQVLFLRFQKETWFNEISAYLFERYQSIEARILDSDRYVSLNPQNNETFSYEFSSILRDIGSVFGSVLDKLVRKTSTCGKEKYDMQDYKEWLISNIPEIHSISVQINLIIPRYLVPFSMLVNKEATIPWWKAYTDLKHSEVDNLVKGNLKNCIDAMASLAILFHLMYATFFISTKIFSGVGFREPKDELETFLF